MPNGLFTIQTFSKVEILRQIMGLESSHMRNQANINIKLYRSQCFEGKTMMTI